MSTLVPARSRLGVIALAVSALLFAAFPLVRPFFQLDVFSQIGLVMVIGITACLVATVLVLPAVLLLVRRAD